MLPLLILPLLFLQSSGEDAQKIKVMFFGDSVVSGMHNKDTEICPFRYEFLRLVKKMQQTVEVVGTNSDPDGTCQKLGEELDVHNNGYQNAGIDELLDFITADLQYLHNPVDYIFSSLGTEDCFKWEQGNNHEILSQSIRRIMGRLLNINENAKIVHLPIMLPETAGSAALECMEVINKKLRDVYGDEKGHDRIRVVKMPKTYFSDSFFTIGKKEENVKVNQQPVVTTTPVAPKPVFVTPKLPIVKPPSVVVTPTGPVVSPPVVTPVVSPPTVVTPQTVVTTTETPVTVQPVVTPQTSTVSQPVDQVSTAPQPQVSNTVPETVNTPRRLDVSVMFLPKQQLLEDIAKVLIDAVHWGFRAKTVFPTPDVTKEPEYYGYDWCMKNYEESVCFEYYYGYSWCLEKYEKDDCYSYYYGDVKEWGKDDNYKWCLNFYDEEYCQFAYLDGKPDTWDWLSFGYHDCVKEKPVDECFNEYYGYAWCVNEYKDEDCYEYYYGGDDWEWNGETSYKWCVNFYTEEDCSERYLKTSSAVEVEKGSTGAVFTVIVVIVVIGSLGWLIWKKKLNFCKSKQYSRLDPMDKGGEDDGLL